MGVASQIGTSLGAYLKAQVQNSIILTGIYMIAFAITGVPWWALTGLFCGLVSLVPTVGGLIALAVGLYAKWMVTDDWMQIGYVGAAWLVIQVVDGFVLSPRAAGHAGVNPLLSIFLTLGAGLIFGPIGVLLAVPVVAVGLIIMRATRRPVS